MTAYHSELISQLKHIKRQDIRERQKKGLKTKKQPEKYCSKLFEIMKQLNGYNE